MGHITQTPGNRIQRLQGGPLRLRELKIAAILLLLPTPASTSAALAWTLAEESHLTQFSPPPSDAQQSSANREPASAVGPTGQRPIKAQNAFGDGLSDLQEKRYEEAIPEFLAALQQTPLLLTARYDLGVAYFAINRFEEARQSFREVLRQDPSHHFAQYFLARIDLIQGNLHLDVTFANVNLSSAKLLQLQAENGVASANAALAAALGLPGQTTFDVAEEPLPAGLPGQPDPTIPPGTKRMARRPPRTMTARWLQRLPAAPCRSLRLLHCQR